MKPDDHYESPGEESTSSSSSFRAVYRPREAPLPKQGLHVDLKQDWEIHLWTRHFGCTEQELRRAVESVGTSAVDVRAWLRRAKPKN